MQVWMYVMSLVNTMPGTLTNVTPDIDAPIIPKATIYHGDRLLPLKKVLLSALRPVTWLMNSKIRKYANKVYIIIINRYKVSYFIINL